MSALDDMLTALSAVYADAVTLADARTAHLVVDSNAVVSRHAVPGVELRVEERGDRIVAELVVAHGAHIETPIHTCIGFLTPRGAQRIELRLRLEPRASATVLAHCLFPNAEMGSHTMDANLEIGADAELRYMEGHYHGLAGA